MGTGRDGRAHARRISPRRKPASSPGLRSRTGHRRSPASAPLATTSARPPRACKRSTSQRTDSCGRPRAVARVGRKTPMLSAGEDLEDLEMGLAPLAVVVIVLGVAAILATAAYFIHRDTIEVEGRNSARRRSSARRSTSRARSSSKQGQSIRRSTTSSASSPALRRSKTGSPGSRGRSAVASPPQRWARGLGSRGRQRDGRLPRRQRTEGDHMTATRRGHSLRRSPIQAPPRRAPRRRAPDRRRRNPNPR